MTTLDYQAHAITTTTLGVPHTGLAVRFQELVTRLFRVIDRQRQRRVLLELDDHMLDDIGVSREAARAEGRKPFWR